MRRDVRIDRECRTFPNCSAARQPRRDLCHVRLWARQSKDQLDARLVYVFSSPNKERKREWWYETKTCGPYAKQGSSTWPLDWTRIRIEGIYIYRIRTCPSLPDACVQNPCDGGRYSFMRRFMEAFLLVVINKNTEQHMYIHTYYMVRLGRSNLWHRRCSCCVVDWIVPRLSWWSFEMVMHNM